MRVSYSPGYFVPLPEDHPFPMGKFPVLRQILLAEGVLRPKEIVEPWEADWADLLPQASEDWASPGLKRWCGVPAWQYKGLLMRQRWPWRGALPATWPGELTMRLRTTARVIVC